MTQIVDFAAFRAQHVDLSRLVYVGPPQDGEVPFLRPSPATRDGLAMLSGVRGKTVSWNQQADVSPFSNTATDSLNYLKLALRVLPAGGGSQIDLYNENLTTAGLFKYMFTASDNGELMLKHNGAAQDIEIVRLGIVSGHKYVIVVNFTGVNPSVEAGLKGQDFELFDLTVMGLDSITTVAEFETWLLAEIGHTGPFGYDAGSLPSVKASALVSTGLNQWDEEWEEGRINNNTGENTPATGVIRSKNYIPVIAGETYFFRCPNNVVIWNIYFYDLSNNFISRTFARSSSDWLINIPQGIAYIRFCENDVDYGGTYRHDLCINISDPDRNGQYMPYWKKDIQLKLSAIKVKSHNVWDEQWEEGDIDSSTGEDVAGTNQIRSSNYIPIEPGASYYIRIPVSGTATVRSRFYDADKNYIGYLDGDGQGVSYNSVFKAPSDACFMRFATQANYGPTYLDNICLNVSDPAFDGFYFPHEGLQPFSSAGMNGVGTPYDELIVDGDGMARRCARRFLRIDLGDGDWEKATSSGGYDFFYTKTGLPILKSYGSGTTVLYPTALCSKYAIKKRADIYAGVEGLDLDGDATPYAYVYDAILASGDAEAFKAAMSGVYLVAELKYPQEFELINPIRTYFHQYEGGTEMVEPMNGSEPSSVSMPCDIRYTKAL